MFTFESSSSRTHSTNGFRDNQVVVEAHIDVPNPMAFGANLLGAAAGAALATEAAMINNAARMHESAMINAAAANHAAAMNQAAAEAAMINNAALATGAALSNVAASMMNAPVMVVHWRDRLEIPMGTMTCPRCHGTRQVTLSMGNNMGDMTSMCGLCDFNGMVPQTPELVLCSYCHNRQTTCFECSSKGYVADWCDVRYVLNLAIQRNNETLLKNVLADVKTCLSKSTFIKDRSHSKSELQQTISAAEAKLQQFECERLAMLQIEQLNMAVQSGIPTEIEQKLSELTKLQSLIVNPSIQFMMGSSIATGQARIRELAAAYGADYSRRCAQAESEAEQMMSSANELLAPAAPLSDRSRETAQLLESKAQSYSQLLTERFTPLSEPIGCPSLAELIRTLSAICSEFHWRSQALSTHMKLRSVCLEALNASNDTVRAATRQAISKAVKDASNVLGSQSTFSETGALALRSLQDAQASASTIFSRLEALNMEDIRRRESRRPVWQADSATGACTRCQKVFGLFTRRHHCRQCGLVVCDSCSSKSKTLPELNIMVPERVCDNCFAHPLMVEAIQVPRELFNMVVPEVPFYMASR